MLGDIHIAEPGALICFAGPRVIQQTIREQLPDGFQRAEYLLEHGMIDMVVHRHEMRDTLARITRTLVVKHKDASADIEAEDRVVTGALVPLANGANAGDSDEAVIELSDETIGPSKGNGSRTNGSAVETGSVDDDVDGPTQPPKGADDSRGDDKST